MTADATIDSEAISLLSGRFGPARTMSLPQDYSTLASAPNHNVSAALEARVGDVIAVYNTGSTGIKGWSEFVYGKAVANASVAIAAKQVMVQDAAGAPYTFTNAPDHCLFKTGVPRAVIAISAMTTLYFGWFWCGGVCPEWLVSGLGGTYATNGDVVVGPIIAADLTADAIGLGLPTAATTTAIGFAETTD